MKPTFSELQERRKLLLSKHEEELRELDAQITLAARADGFKWQPLDAPGRKDPAMSSLKKAFHAEMRAEAIKRGWFKEGVRGRGKPDVERVRLLKKSEELSASQGKTITPADVARMEAAEKTRRTLERLKASSDGKIKAKR